MKKSLAALALCAAVSSQAHALIVDHGDYLSDTVTGLDWLDVTKSINMSFEYVKTQFGARGRFAGWRYATDIELNALIGSYTGSIPLTSARNTYPEGVLDGLVDLFGPTEVDFRGTLRKTSGIIIGPPSIAQLQFADIFDYDRSSTKVDFFSYGMIISGRPIPASSTKGSFLTRPTTHVATNGVPEPSTVALLGLGLLGFAVNRRKAKSK